MITKQIILAAGFLLLLFTASSQEKYCARAGKYLPENDCNECVLNSKYNVVVQTILDVSEINRMEEELQQLVEKSDAYYKTYGNLKQKGFNELDLDLKKLFLEMEKNPQKADELLGWLEGVLEDAGCGKGRFDGRTEGVGNGGLQGVRDGASSATNNLKFPQYSGPARLSLDCCRPQEQPNDHFIQQAQQIHSEFLKFKSMFEDLKMMHEINMRGVQFATWQFMKYDKNARDRMEQLRNNSFTNVVGGALVQSGAMTQVQQNQVNSILQKYAESNDKLGARAEIERLLGKDIGDLYGAMFEDFTPADLLGAFGDYIKNNPGKLKALNKLSKFFPSTPQWFGTFMNLVGIAEMSVNVIFDTFLKLGGNSVVIRTQNELWCVAAWYYYCAASSLLKNAAALYQLKRALNNVQSFFPEKIIPMQGPAPKFGWEADKAISSAIGCSTQLKGTLRANNYTVQLPDEKTVVFVFGSYNCGKWTERQKAEVTPGPNERKTNSTILLDPKPMGGPSYKDTIPTFGWVPAAQLPPVKPVYKLKIIPVYPKPADSLNSKSKVQVNAGFIAGAGWYIAGKPDAGWLQPKPYSEFSTEQKAEINDKLDAALVTPNGSMRTNLLPACMLGFTAGAIFENRYEVNFSAFGGMYNAVGDIPIKAIRIVPPTSPSTPPSTRQSNENINVKMPVGLFDAKLGARIYFGKAVKGFVDAGGLMGLNHTNGITYSFGSGHFSEAVKQTAVYGGGYLNTGVSVPITGFMRFELTAGSNLLTIKKRFAAMPNVGLGLKFRL